MKKMLYSGITLLLILTAKTALAESDRVATTLPITQALATTLLMGTEIDVVYLPPTRLPVNRIANWLRHKSQSRINKTGPFDVLVTVESVWPHYAAYGRLRSQNIHLVAIDVARELNQPGLQVRLPAAADRQYFWLAPDNLLVMAQILVRDLIRLWPQHKAVIQANQQRLTGHIQRYTLAVDEALIQHQISSVCVQNEELIPQAEALFLPFETAAECNNAELILTKLKSGTERSARLWRINAAERLLDTGLNDWMDGNLLRLTQSLVKDGK